MNNNSQMSTTQHHSSLNRFVFYFLSILIFLIPWPHGGEVDWQYLIIITSIFSLSAFLFLFETKESLKSIIDLKLIVLSLGLWLGYQAIQIIPIPVEYLISVGVELPKINSNEYNTISVHTQSTAIDLMKNASYICLFLITLLVIDCRQRAVLFTKFLFFSSSIIALYSLVNYLSHGSLDLVPSIPPWTITWDKAVHGTFSYQNHYAAFLILTIPLGVGLIIDTYRRKFFALDFKHLKNFYILLFSPIGFYSLCIIIMYIALILTSSRGGNVAFSIGIFATTMITLILGNPKNYRVQLRKLLKWLGVAAIVISALVVTGFADALIKRLTENGLAQNGRDLMRQTAYQIIEQHPLYGTGAGTYPLIQHKYKSPELGTSEMSKRAHNDYLELLANQGFIGFTLLALPILYLLYSIFISLSRNRESSLYGIKAASFCSVMTVLIHSLADFNFQLPAIAIYFFTIMAIALKCDQVSRNKKIKV